MTKRYAVALDLSGRSAGFALMYGRELLRVSARSMRGRDSAGLADFISAELASGGIVVSEISDWTVGAGPGSFTGMRLVAALVSGLTWGRKDKRARCVPSAIALAACLKTAPGDRIGCLFNGYNHEIIYFGIENLVGELVPTGEAQVLDQEQSKEFFKTCPDQYFCALTDEIPAIELLLNGRLKIQTVDNLDISALVTCSYRKFDNNLTDLVYIRPAVYTAPIV